jgi:hypothetical protein
MSKFEQLLQQAARAERLSKAILDTLTVDRLQAFAADCRAQASALSNEHQAGSSPQNLRPAA